MTPCVPKRRAANGGDEALLPGALLELGRPLVRPPAGSASTSAPRSHRHPAQERPGGPKRGLVVGRLAHAAQPAVRRSIASTTRTPRRRTACGPAAATSSSRKSGQDEVGAGPGRRRSSGPSAQIGRSPRPTGSRPTSARGEVDPSREQREGAVIAVHQEEAVAKAAPPGERTRTGGSRSPRPIAPSSSSVRKWLTIRMFGSVGRAASKRGAVGCSWTSSKGSPRLPQRPRRKGLRRRPKSISGNLDVGEHGRLERADTTQVDKPQAQPLLEKALQGGDSSAASFVLVGAKSSGGPSLTTPSRPTEGRRRAAARRAASARSACSGLPSSSSRRRANAEIAASAGTQPSRYLAARVRVSSSGSGSIIGA